mgnify:FL=1
MSLYKQIFLDAFNFTRCHKALWIFGFFAILFSGSVEADLYYNFLNSQKNNLYNLGQMASTGIFNKEVWFNLPQQIFSADSSIGFLVFTFFGLSLAALFILTLSVGSQVLIIEQSNLLLNNPKAPLAKFSDLVLANFKDMRVIIAKAAFVNVLFKFFLIISFLLIALPIFLSSGLPNIIADFSYLLLFVVLTPIIILGSLYSRYLVISLVTNKNSLKQASCDAWSLISKSWLLSIEISLALFVFNILSVFITLTIISGLALLLWFFALAAQSFSYQAYVLVIALSYFILFLVFLLCNALLSTFSISVWTNLYLKLTKSSKNKPLQGLVGNFSK